MIKKILIIVLFCLVQNTFGQIFMTSMRGVLNSKVSSTMFSGGKGYGDIQKPMIQSVCPPLQVESIFYGGLGYGDQQQNVIQSFCLPQPVVDIFYGGLGYGDQQQNVIQSVCLPQPVVDIFYGGLGYGDQQQNNIQSVCLPQPVVDIFYGGLGYGDQQKSVIQNACLSQPIESIFYGGNGYGDQQQKVIQTDCSTIITNGLVFSLDANDARSYPGTGNTWFDLSGNNNNISWTTPAPQFIIDNGIKVLQTSSAVGTLRAMVSTNYNNLPIGNQSYTAISFFKPNSTIAAKMLFSMGPADNSCGGTQIHSIGIGTLNKFAGGSCGGLGTWQNSTGVSPSTTSYVCVATSYGNSIEKVYVNGSLDKSASMTTNIPTSVANKICIGWVRDDGADYTMDANIGIILFFNRELSSSEISQIYNAYRLRFGL